MPGVCEKDICARSKHAIIRKSLSGEAHKQILQKSARDSHHRMNCGSGVIWVMRKCVSGAWNKHICDFVNFHEIRICYVYHGHIDTCDLRFKNCSGFIVLLAENRAAARGFNRHCLENSLENQKNNIWARYSKVCFVDKTSFKSPPANETMASKCSWKHQNIDYFVGFIDSCDGETKPINLMKIRQMHEPGGDELLLILRRF